MKLIELVKNVIATIAQHLEVWRLAWQHHKQQDKLPGVARDGLEFLPAALEIQETPPSPLGRKIVYLIITVFLVAVIWATLGKIDIIAVAQGKIIPSDYSKVIQPLESGVIKAIHVRDGQHVRRGAVLIELDTTLTGADQERVQHEHDHALLEAARLRALIEDRDTMQLPENSDSESAQLQQQLLQEALSETRNRIQSAELTVEQREAALEVTKSNIQRLETTLPLIAERAKAMGDMVKQKFISKSQYLELEEERVNKEHELAMERHKLVQDKAALLEAQRAYQGLVAQIKGQWQTQLAEVETRIKALSKEQIKAVQRNTQQTLIAPIDGVVQQLAVHTVGGVVTPAQQLMVIAPNEAQLEVEAWLENKDIGFVNAGQSAEIKVEAFPFTQYGVIDGKLLHLSQDAVPMDKIGHVYSARVSMARTTIEVGEKQVTLSPGMNVSVEVKTGQRRVIEYFLNPILRGFKETARER